MKKLTFLFMILMVFVTTTLQAHASTDGGSGLAPDSQTWLQQVLTYFSIGALFWWILVLAMFVVPFPLIASEKKHHPWYTALLLIVGLTVNFSANPEIWGKNLLWFFGGYLALILVWGRVRFSEIRSRTDRYYKLAVRKFIESKNLRGADDQLLTAVPSASALEFDKFWITFASEHGVSSEVVEYKGKTARHINMLAIYFPWDLLATAWRWLFREFIEMLLDQVRELLLKDTRRSENFYKDLVGVLPGTAQQPVSQTARFRS